MASWFTRTLDTLTPWNRGGEVQRRQERKKKEEERQQQNNRASQAPTLRVTTASPTQKVTVQNNLPKPQRPENLFQDLNKSLTISAPKNVLNVTKSQDTAPVEKPTPGTVVQPTLKVTNNPNNQRIKLPDGRYADEIPDTPERIIDRGLDAGKSWEQIARENNYRLDGVREYSKATRPNYGITIKKPNQSIGNKFRDIFDANTEADKYRRQQGNIEKGENKNLTLENPGNLISRTPIVGHVTKMVNTAGVQIPQVGLTAQQMFATKERSAAEEELRNAKASKDPVRIAAANRRVDGALQRLDDIQEDLNRVESFFKKNKGGWFNAGTLYDEEAAKRGDIKTGVTDIALPTAVTALDLYTLGKGSTISEALKQSGKAGLRSQGGNIAKMTAGNYLSGDLSARAEGATGWDPIKSGSINAVLGSAPDIGLPLIGRSFKNRVLPKIFKGRGVDPTDVVDELDDAAISASAEAAIQATRPRPIKIAQNIPVKAPDDIATPIDVVRRPSGRPLIKELEGDFNFPTFEQLQQIRVDDMKKAADVANSTARPDPAVSGITPRTPEAPYTLSETAIKGSQDQLIDEYAAFLKDIGEGNGVDLVPDGELYGYGKKRVSNNVRFGDTKGKRMTKAMWREEAERQLRAGEAEPGIQQAFNDAADPEVQSMLSKGDTTEEAPIGRPIEVKQAQGIPVRDETIVPTDLPETPGQVRITEATAPMAAKSEAVANQPVITNLDGSRVETDGGDVILYHRTSKEAADSIAREGKLDPNRAGTGNDKALTEDGRVSYLTTNDSQDFYGDQVVRVRMPIKQFQDQLQKNQEVIAKLEAEIASGKIPEMYIPSIRAQIENIKKNPEILSDSALSVYKKTTTVPMVKTPLSLPKETQNILDNPKQFSKRQVAAARNQRKLAKQMAKTQEDTVAAMERINASNPKRVAGQSDGFAPTGEFGRGKRGNAYQKASNEAEELAGRKEMDTRSVDDLVSEIGAKESFTPGDRRRLQAAIENMAKAEPDNIEMRTILRKLQSKSRTELGQALALIPRAIRRSASADTLVNRWESKIARALDNPSKMSADDFAEVQRANDAFTLARDRAAQLDEQFKRTGSEADFKAWQDAHNAARKADTDAKFTEVAVAKRVLKGEKGAHVNKVLDELKKESDVNTMDFVTANMLSGTATGFRNTFGTELSGIENRLFANTRAKITNKLFGENVGGFDRSGARLGRKVGLTKWGRDAARRAEIGGKNPIEWAKNWSTTINSGGESSLQSQVYSRLGKYYKNQFDAQGVTGKELDMRMRHAMLTDPDSMADTYLDAAMKSSGLSGLFEKGQTIEKAVTDWVGKGTDSKTAQGAAKLVMRLAVGFPTATANFLYQSAKRLTLGLPSYIETGVKLGKGDRMGAALAFERAMKESGSGAAMLGLGAALGSAGLISGSYPDDPEERARWEREGISENSIKIGGAWYPIPQGAGMLGLPLMTGAAIGRDGADGVAEMYTPKNLSKLLPTDQIQGFLNMASGDGAPQDFKNFVASSVRAVTPFGALLNQIAKSTDETKNDTTTKNLAMNIVDQILSGIPGVNNMANIPDKKDDAGNVINNPNPAQLFFGATSASQSKGEQRSADIVAQIDSSLQSIADTGAFADPNLREVLDDKTAQIYNKVVDGEKVDESDLKKLQDGLVEGVSKTGDDTAYLERGQYDTNLTVLRLKKQLMEADKTTKPSDIQKMDVAIKRGEVYRDGEIPYEMIDAYQNTGVEDWRKMGDPESDDYDPERYQQLWVIDELMTKAGVSYRKGALDKQKYYAKEGRSGSGSRSGSRSGGSRSDNFSPEFGKLKTGDFAPSVQAYQTIDQKSGTVPMIRTVRPNIVHKIGSSG